jgi:hypothetical protein
MRKNNGGEKAFETTVDHGSRAGGIDQDEHGGGGDPNSDSVDNFSGNSMDDANERAGDRGSGGDDDDAGGDNNDNGNDSDHDDENDDPENAIDRLALPPATDLADGAAAADVIGRDIVILDRFLAHPRVALDVEPFELGALLREVRPQPRARCSARGASSPVAL